MTGVLVLVGGSLLLQEANDTKQQRRKRINCRFSIADCRFDLLILWSEISSVPFIRKFAIGNEQLAIISPPHAGLPRVQLVPVEAAHRERDTRLRPTCRGRRVGTAQNRRDEKDCLSNRLVYRRLGISW